MRARPGTRRWLPSGCLARRTRGVVLGGVWLRCRTWRRRYELERELARGADPMQSDELSLRVGQLGSAGMRVRLAHALREAVAVANGHRASLTTTPLRCREIQENEELLVVLAARIRDGAPLGVQGLALTALLMNARSSPLYRPGVGSSLPATVSEALEALDYGHRTAGQVHRWAV